MATHRHVGLTAGVHGLGHRVHQVATDAKVTHFHLALSVDENIGGLHIWTIERHSEKGREGKKTKSKQQVATR